MSRRALSTVGLLATCWGLALTGCAREPSVGPGAPIADPEGSEQSARVAVDPDAACVNLPDAERSSACGPRTAKEALSDFYWEEMFIRHALEHLSLCGPARGLRPSPREAPTTTMDRDCSDVFMPLETQTVGEAANLSESDTIPCLQRRPRQGDSRLPGHDGRAVYEHVYPARSTRVVLTKEKETCTGSPRRRHVGAASRVLGPGCYFEKPSNISTNPQVRKPDPTMAPMINSIALPPTLPRSSSSAFADSITPFPNSD